MLFAGRLGGPPVVPSAAVFAPVLDQSFAHVLALSARLFHNDALLRVLVKGVRRARSRAALDRRLVVLVPLSTHPQPSS
jgi:hypothetical protein